MINDVVATALNRQINAELYSSYLYLSMSAYCQAINYDGFAKWMAIQAQEEYSHGMKIYEYLQERGGRVILDAIAKPQTEWESPLEVFEQVYQHEQEVTSLIHQLVDLAIEVKDHATFNFLQWFVEEQVEEEAHADAIVQKLQMVAKSPNGLFMMDRELAKRGSGK